MCLRHDKGTQQGNGVTGGSLAAELRDKHSFNHTGRRRLHKTHFTKETGCHHKYQHCYQNFQLPNLPIINSMINIIYMFMHATIA